MKRIITLNEPVAVTELVAEAWSMEVFVDAADVGELCLELLLLHEGLSARLSIGPCNSNINLTVTKTSEFGAFVFKGNAWHVILSVRELEFALNFLLLLYRDGFAPVQHIDIELRSENDTSQDLTLVFSTKNFAPPMSAEDARRLLFDE